MTQRATDAGAAARTEGAGPGSWLDPLVFSSVWVASAAAALSLATALAMRTRPNVATLLLIFCGTLVVYDVDRLRDLRRDRVTSPLRSAFVAAHRRALVSTVLLAGAASLVLAPPQGPRALVLLAPVLAAGLLHRRLKQHGWWKPLYVSAAWTAVVVGLPAVVSPWPRDPCWSGAIVGATLVANVIASSLRDDEAWSARFGAGVPLRIARGVALLAVLVAAVAPAPVRSLLPIPLLTLAALAGFRADERYGLVVVDGALLVGALLALPLLA